MNKMIRQLNRDILDILAARRPGGLPNRRALQNQMKEPSWVEGLAALVPVRERLSCARILELCTPILGELCPQGPEKGWGPFCYQ